MTLSIQALDFKSSNAIRVHLTRRLKYAFSSYHARVKDIKICLSGVVGQQNDSENYCHIQVKFDCMADIEVQDVQSDIYIAIDRSIDKLRRIINRRLVRQRNEKHLYNRPTMALFADF